jgi:hypothetical protein
MEPLSLFTSLISMLRIFKQERGDGKKANRQAFLEWLEYHRHEDLKNFIANTAAVRTEVDNILAADHALMLQKLDGIQELVATLLSRVDEFRGLSLAITPDSQLSDQAVSILRQFADSEGDFLHYANFGQGQFILNVLPGGEPNVTEPRFIKSDLDKLVQLGFLNIAEYNSDGNPLYCLTRNAVRYLQTINAKTTLHDG